MSKSGVFISGATRGIGLSLARIFKENGYSLVLHGSSIDSLNNIQAEFPEARLIPADLSIPEECSQLCDILKSLTPPDILINNAGTFLPGQIHNEAPGVFEKMISVNLASAYHISRALLPGMMERKSGMLVNMCSIASLVAYPSGGSYCISKFGLLGMSKVLREELKPFDIKVMSVLPGATYTDSWSGSGLPESRFISVSDLASLIFTACTLHSGAVVEELLVRPLQGDID